MAILRIWRTDRGKTLPISFVCGCEFLTQMADSLGSGQRQAALPSTSKGKWKETSSSPPALPVTCVWLANWDSVASRGGGGGRGGRRRRKANKYLEKIYLLEVLLSTDQEIKNAHQKGDSLTNVLLSKTRHPKFQLLFHVHIKVISSPKLTKIGTRKIPVNPLEATTLLS